MPSSQATVSGASRSSETVKVNFIRSLRRRSDQNFLELPNRCERDKMNIYQFSQMANMRSLIFISFLLLSIVRPFSLCANDTSLASQPTAAQHSNLERRAAIDMGSGSIKLQIADIDTAKNHLHQSLFSKIWIVPFSDDLARSSDNTLSAEVQEKALQALAEMKSIAIQYGIQNLPGVATAVFRQAANAPQIVQRIRNELAIDMRIIDQDEEGALGYFTAKALSDIQTDNIVVWDFGAASFQLTTLSGGHINVLQGDAGRVTLKTQMIRDIQHRDLLTADNPHPVSRDEVLQAIDLMSDKFGVIPDEISERLADPNVIVIGLAHPRSVIMGRQLYTIGEVWELLNSAWVKHNRNLRNQSPR